MGEGWSRKIWSVSLCSRPCSRRSILIFPTVPTYMCLYLVKRELLSGRKLDKKCDDSTHPSPHHPASLSLSTRPCRDRRKGRDIRAPHQVSCTRQSWQLCLPTSANPELGGAEGSVKAAQLVHNEKDCASVVGGSSCKIPPSPYQ